MDKTAWMSQMSDQHINERFCKKSDRESISEDSTVIS